MDSLNYIFTNHAQIRINQRDITEREIISVIKQPDSIEPGFKERQVIRRKLSRGTLEVIYRKLGNKIIVITCYWIKNPREE